MTDMKKIIPLLVALGLSSALSAQFSTYWYDSFDGGYIEDINTDTAGRQGGPLAGISYVINHDNVANPWQSVLLGPNGPMRLGANGGVTNPVLTSPNYNWVGSNGSDIIGKRISVVMDANIGGLGAGTYTQAAVTVGGSSTLQQFGLVGSGFSVVWIEDQEFGNGNFLQVFDGNNLLANGVPNPNGAGGGFLEIFIDDPTDGNPWDGTGSIEFEVHIDGTNIVAPDFVFNPSNKPSLDPANYTSNYITFEGAADSVGGGLALHTFDEVLVSNAPIPEPKTMALALGALALGLVMFRRFKSGS